MPHRPIAHLGSGLHTPTLADLEAARKRAGAIVSSIRTNETLVSAIKKLTEMDIFHGVSAEQLTVLIETGKITALDMADGQCFIREGDKNSESFFIIIHGQVIVTSKGKKLATLMAGDPVGHYGYLGEMPRTANVISQGWCILFQITRSKMETEDEIRYKLLSNISKLLVMQVRMGNEQIRQLEEKLEEAESDQKDNSKTMEEYRTFVCSVTDYAHRIWV